MVGRWITAIDRPSQPLVSPFYPNQDTPTQGNVLAGSGWFDLQSHCPGGVGLVNVISGAITWVSLFTGGPGFCTLFLCGTEYKVGGKVVGWEAGGNGVGREAKSPRSV